MRIFVLMRNQLYAQIIAKTENTVIRTTESELLGVMPQKGDYFIIDAHFTGAYSDMEGIKTVSKLIDCFGDKLINIELWSWFPETYMKVHYHYLCSNHVKIKQFPA